MKSNIKMRRNINKSGIILSVGMIVKNEEKHLENCLSALKKLLDNVPSELIIVDTGSTDRTKEIAAKYADKVLDFEWIDDFSAARNFCAKNASNNWILALDCDEYVNKVDVHTIRILMQKFPKCTGVIRLKNIVIDDDGKTGY